MLGHNPAESVQRRTERPDGNRPGIPFLRTDPVDEPTGKQQRNGIKQRKDSRDRSVIVIGPVELLFEEGLQQ